MLAEAPIHFEQILAQYANSIFAKNEEGQIWCEQNKVFISFVSPKFKVHPKFGVIDMELSAKLSRAF
ncbi:MAG: hypothetical protein J6N71_04470 [Muribaculaceae bacterium]|nr:hypothetical protein [Muribaculaceae bacterium]